MSSISPSLLVIETHPVQYRVPVYRALQAKWGVKVHVIYASDFSIAGYFDKHFHATCSWDVDLVSGIDRSTFLEFAAQGGATCFDEISAKGLGKAVRNASADAVLVTGYYPLFHLQAIYHAMGLRRPILFRAETIDAKGKETFKGRLKDAVLRQLYARCARLMPIGKLSRDHYLRLGCSEDKLVFSRYCVDSAPFRCDEKSRAELRPETRAELGVAPDRILIVLSGKIYAHKRPRLLLDAVRLLPEPWRDRVELLFLGSGPDLDAIREEAAAEPRVRVSCTGFKGQPELSRYYHASDLLVLPSISETWGLVVNEALHHGLPCVVSDTVGSGPDLVHAGVTGEIAGGSAPSLRDAIIRAFPLMGDPAIRSECRMAVCGYTVEKAADGMFQAFDEVTQPASSAREPRWAGVAARR